MSTPTKMEFAEKEYFFLQAEVGRFDVISHRIKNWSITVSFALMGAAFHQKIPVLFLIATLSTVLFWITESRWKRFQVLHIRRVKEIEAYFLDSHVGYEGPVINKSFVKHLGTLEEGRKEELEIMFRGNVSMPHHVIVLLSSALFILARFNVLNL